MAEHITEAIVNDICRRAVEQDPASPTAWESVDPMVQHGLRSAAAEFLADSIPVLIAHGWIPPTPEGS